MKKLLFLLGITGVLTSCGQNNADNSAPAQATIELTDDVQKNEIPEGMESDVLIGHKSEEHQFKIDFPAGWNVSENHNEKMKLVIINPENKDGFQENLFVEIYPKEEKSVDQYMQDLSQYENFQLIEEHDGNNQDNVNSKIVFYSFSYKDVDGMSMAFIYDAGERILVVTGSASPERFKKFENLFAKVASSLRF